TSPLPDHQPLASKGRVSKVAGFALLGQVYLTMATTLDAANRTANLNAAKTNLTSAYTKRTFGALKEIPYADVFDVAKKSTNPEIIFQIVNKQGDINYSSGIAASNQAQGETINSQRTNTGVGGNVTPDLVKEYEETDLRKAFSIKFANAATVKDYFITKYRDASAAAGTNGYGGNDWILIRYADVMLMLAEVNLYLGDEASAVSFLDQVRERAGMPKYEVARTNATYSSQFPTLKLAILHERRVELAFENHRWFDLLRFFTPTELVTYIRAKSQADFGVAKLSNFGTKDYYYPIPFDENKLKVLLIRSDLKQYEGQWSLLGDLVKSDEGLDEAAYRILKQRTGLNDVFLEQVHTFGEVDRHPASRVVTVAYCSLINIQHHKLKICGLTHQISHGCFGSRV
ncbi:MAG: RagB/SusD family nutrient uptake outer membrane protein, partial [Sphingobacteriales bacterium]